MMEDPPKHDDNNNKKKKENTKTMPPAINIGARGFGMGGILLFGGALVTATLVSALAIKTRRQRRSSSDAFKKSTSPSPEKQTVDAPNDVELMMKINKDRESSKDFSVDSSPPDLQNQSSDGVTSMKKMQTKPIQNLTPDEKQNSEMDNDEKVHSGDGNEDVIFSVVGEDPESTSIYVVSVFEREELDHGYEKTASDCEKEVVVAAQTEFGFSSSEQDSCSKILVISAPRDDGGEELKFPMVIDNENDEQTDTGTEKSLVSNQALTSIEESIQYEKTRDITVEAAQGQVLLGDDVAEVAEEDDDEEEEEIPTGHVGEDQETVFMNEAAALEAACVDQVKVEDNPQVQFLEEEKEKNGHDEMIPENCEGDLINETGYADQIDSELVMGEEAIDAACVHQIEVEDSPQVQFLEEEEEKDCHDEIILENCHGDLSNKNGSANQIVREENQQMQYNSKQVMGEEQAIKAACVDSVNMEDILEMVDHEVALEDVQEMHMNEVHETFTSGEHPSSAVACIMNLDDSLRVAVDDQTAVRKNNPPRQLMNKEEKVKETAQKVEEEVITEDELVNKEEKDKEGRIRHVQLIEAAKVDDQAAVREDNPPRQLMNKEKKGKETAVEVQVEIPEDELVKKEGKSKEDEVSHVQLIEEDEEAKDDDEDVTVKTKVSSDGTGGSSIESNGVAIWPDESMQEELTPERKVGNQKKQENMEEDQTILGKGQNDSDHNGNMKEDKDSKSASSYGERFVMDIAKGRKLAPAGEPWNPKLRTWSVLVSIWCLCHWYSELPFPELSLVGSLLFILILLGFRNRTTYLVKYE